MKQEEYRSEFAKLLDIYKDSNMALNKNLVVLMSKYIRYLELPKTCEGCKWFYGESQECMSYCSRGFEDKYEPKELL